MTNAEPKHHFIRIVGATDCIHCGQPVHIGGTGTTHYYEHVNGNIECEPDETDE